MFKKILLSFLTANIVLFSFFTTAAKAQATSTWYQQSFFEWYDKVYDQTNQDEIFGERYTAAQVEWVIYGTFSWVINHVGIKELNWCVISLLNAGLSVSLFEFITSLATDCSSAIDPLNALYTWAGFGAVFSADIKPLPYASTIPANTSPPETPPSNLNLFPPNGISFVGYLKGIGNKLNIIPETQAQGFGSTRAIAGVDHLWRFVRDITYFVLVIIIIVMAFMIMFRVKLSPQTAVTLQSAIPKIIVTLVLITFSYAIAGLLIDIMYVVLGLLAALFTMPGNGISGDTWETMFLTFTVRNTLGLFVVYWVLFIVAMFYAMIAFMGPVVGVVFGVILAVLAMIILLIVLVFLTFKVIWMMIKNFVEILLLVAFAPIFIVGGPVGILGFGTWVKQMAARLAVYPVVAVLLVFTFYFLATAFQGGGTVQQAFAGIIPFNPTNLVTTDNVWDPPLTMGSGAMILMYTFVSVVTLTLIPRAADVVKGAFSGRPFAVGTAIGEALGPSARFVGGQAEGQALGRLGDRWGGKGPASGVRASAVRFAARRGHGTINKEGKFVRS